MNADLVLTAIAWIWVAAGAGLVGFSFYVLHEDGFPHSCPN